MTDVIKFQAKRHTLFSAGGLLVLLYIAMVAMLNTANPQHEEVEGTSTFVPGEYTVRDLQVKDKEKDEWIAIGMDRSEVERRLGAEGTQSFRGVDYGGLLVYYRDGKAAALTVLAGDNAYSRYITYRGAGLGMGLKEVQALYGEEKPEELHGSFSTTFVGQREGERLIRAEGPASIRNRADSSEAYVISFSYFKNDARSVSGIYISDHQYAYTGK